MSIQTSAPTPETILQRLDWHVIRRLDGQLQGDYRTIFYGTRVERTIPARSGRVQVLRLINDLLKQPQLPRAPFTDLSPLLQAGLGGIKRRSLVFVISDFISAPGWERPLSLLNQRHEVVAIRLWDPREVELPDIGPIIMEDAETGEHLYVDN